MQQFQATVTMTPTTAQTLQQAGNQLYLFRRVLSSDDNGRPALWASAPYAQTTQVQWSADLDAYTCVGPIKEGVVLTPEFSTPIDTGQQLRVDSTGDGQVTSNGYPGDVSFLNESTRPFTCGLSSPFGGGEAPFCAFPLNGSGLQVIEPALVILLMFSTKNVRPGTVVEDFYGLPLASFGPAVLIDFSTGDQRDLSYDCDTGWSWGSFTWAQQVAAGTDLVPLLVVPPS